MRALGFALAAALAIGCSSTPTAPTSSFEPVAAAVSQDVKPDHTAGTLKVTIYFYAPDLPYGGSVHLTGAPVVVWFGSETPVALLTNRQGSIGIDVPRSGVDRVYYRIDPQNYDVKGWSGCIHAPASYIPVPYGTRENWVLVRTDCTL